MDNKIDGRNVQDMQTEILLRQIDAAKQQFSELDRRDVRIIPENMFVHHFLPFFSGERTENAQETIANWLTIAGSPVHPVNIVNSGGQVVVQVPPIQNNTTLDPAAPTDTNLAYAVKESRAISSLSPNAGQSILTGQLSNKLSALTSQLEQKNKEHENKWNALLTHYGKKPINYKEDEKVADDKGDVFGF